MDLKTILQLIRQPSIAVVEALCQRVNISIYNAQFTVLLLLDKINMYFGGLNPLVPKHRMHYQKTSY